MATFKEKLEEVVTRLYREGSSGADAPASNWSATARTTHAAANSTHTPTDKETSAYVTSGLQDTLLLVLNERLLPQSRAVRGSGLFTCMWTLPRKRTDMGTDANLVVGFTRTDLFRLSFNSVTEVAAGSAGAKAASWTSSGGQVKEGFVRLGEPVGGGGGGGAAAGGASPAVAAAAAAAAAPERIASPEGGGAAALPAAVEAAVATSGPARGGGGADGAAAAASPAAAGGPPPGDGGGGGGGGGDGGAPAVGVVTKHQLILWPQELNDDGTAFVTPSSGARLIVLQLHCSSSANKDRNRGSVLCPARVIVLPTAIPSKFARKTSGGLFGLPVTARLLSPPLPEVVAFGFGGKAGSAAAKLRGTYLFLSIKHFARARVLMPASLWSAAELKKALLYCSSFTSEMVGGEGGEDETKARPPVDELWTAASGSNQSIIKILGRRGPKLLHTATVLSDLLISAEPV